MKVRAFYPRTRFVSLTAGAMFALFIVLATLTLDNSLFTAVGIFLVGLLIAGAFAAPYVLRKRPSMFLDDKGLTLVPTFSKRVFVPWHCLVSARTAIRAKHHLRLEVDWTKLKQGDEDPEGETLPHPRSAPLELHGLRRIDLDANVHDVLLILQSYRDEAAA